MSLQNMIFGALRRMPHFMLRRMAGPPLRVDGHEMDLNMQILANMAARQPQETPASVEAYRAAVKQFDAVGLPRRGGIEISDVTLPLATGALEARIYAPKKPSDTDPCILFFHQGGMVIMDHETDDRFCSVLADECNAKVISLNYRLCPESKFPAAIDDALALWDYVHEHAATLKIDVRRVAVAGDSAGGLISATMCQVLRDRGAGQPVAQLLVYPWVSTNLQSGGSLESCAEMFPLRRETMEYFNAHVFPDGKGMDHAWANPLHSENLQKLPPAIIATAGFDPIRDQGDEYADALAAVGNPVQHYCFGALTHSFLMMGRISNAAEAACVQLAQDLAAHLGR